MGRRSPAGVIQHRPSAIAFSPQYPCGEEGKTPATVWLSYAELESVRLVHTLNMNQAQAASEMRVSQAKFSRLYRRALERIVTALVEERHLNLSPGDSETQ